MYTAQVLAVKVVTCFLKENATTCKTISQLAQWLVMLATKAPAPGSIPGGDRVFKALTDRTVDLDQDLKNAGPVLCLVLRPRWLKHAR